MQFFVSSMIRDVNILCICRVISSGLNQRNLDKKRVKSCVAPILWS